MFPFVLRVPYGNNVPASRSPFALAALATAAVPGLEPVGASGVESSYDVDMAVVVDSQDRRWTVRAPRTPISGAAMEGEAALLANLARAVDDGDLAFEVPRPQGFASLPEGGRAVVYPEIAGRPLAVADLTGPLAQEAAGVLAAIHSLPPAEVAQAGLPVYSALEYRERRLGELDEAAATGLIPRELLQRWEEACEDVRLWRFIPTVVHGDLSPENILVHQGRVVGVTQWSQARVGDPADDLAPLLAAAPEEGMDELLTAYESARGIDDAHLLGRSVLASELAILRWLMHGVRNDERAIIDDAVGMLGDLDSAVAGAEPIASLGGGPAPVSPAEPTSPAEPPAEPAGPGEPGPSAAAEAAPGQGGSQADPVVSQAAPGSSAIPLDAPALGEPEPAEPDALTAPIDLSDDSPTAELPTAE